ncbi:NUDIX domain-containing protein [Thermobacillus composti]|uniref:NUDIX domain-containing protein n=1 Tax=Thermobacillus composti TaxID=377615 RepID=UPI000A0605AD
MIGMRDPDSEGPPVHARDAHTVPGIPSSTGTLFPSKRFFKPDGARTHFSVLGGRRRRRRRAKWAGTNRTWAGCGGRWRCEADQRRVQGIILDGEGKALLVRRADNGRRVMPAGAMEPDESVPDALEREVREETGREVGEAELVEVCSDPERYSCRSWGCDYQMFAFVFVVTRWSGELFRETPGAVDAAFFDPDDLRSGRSAGGRPRALHRDDRGSEGLPADRQGHRGMNMPLSGTPSVAFLIHPVMTWRNLATAGRMDYATP